MSTCAAWWRVICSNNHACPYHHYDQWYTLTVQECLLQVPFGVWNQLFWIICCWPFAWVWKRHVESHIHTFTMDSVRSWGGQSPAIGRKVSLLAILQYILILDSDIVQSRHLDMQWLENLRGVHPQWSSWPQEILRICYRSVVIFSFHVKTCQELSVCYAGFRRSPTRAPQFLCSRLTFWPCNMACQCICKAAPAHHQHTDFFWQCCDVSWSHCT